MPPPELVTLIRGQFLTGTVRAAGWPAPGQSSNWWIKTARCEDNKVEATMAGKLKTMPTSSLSVVIQHLVAGLRPEGAGMTDGELLARFLGSRDDDALAALVRRHAPMVWGVCRRLLNHHDAEDAFQATFLVLVRKAAAVPGQAVANWLYGMARQTAVRLRATAAKRGRREKQVVNMPEPTVPQVRDADLQKLVDDELSRLPDHYRGVIVLCDLEGRTRKEAAQQLGIPEGSVASRLARARVMLAKRLTQRGVVFSGGSVAAVLSAGSASASAPPALVVSTIKAVSLLAAGQTAGVVSAKVAALTEGVVKAMFVTKIKSVLAVVLVVGLLVGGIGAGLLSHTQAVEQPKDSNKVVQAPKPDEKEAVEKQPRKAKPGEKVLTPEQAIKQRPKEKVTVQFKVTAAQMTLISKSNVVGKPAGFSGGFILLKDGDSFSVRVVPPAMDTIKRLGIDPDKHFKGEVVQVTGLLEPGPSPGLFQILVNDLTQIEHVSN
jgi:RNA polymerase sigma factor (sigma-70 family)